MDVYKYSFPEAIEYLATQANIPIEYEEWDAKDDGLYQRKKTHASNQQRRGALLLRDVPKEQNRAILYQQQRVIQRDDRNVRHRLRTETRRIV